MEQKYIVFKNHVNELKRIRVRDEAKARLFLDKPDQTFNVNGHKVEVLGLYTEEEFKVLDMFNHESTDHYEKWVSNMKYLKKHGKWPE